METENDYKLAFLDTAVSRAPDCRLTTGVYRKPTHTDQYQELLVLSVRFPPPAISETRYCQVPLRARQTSRNRTLCYLQGEKYTCLLFLSPMVTLFLSWRKITKTRNRVPVLSSRSNTSLLRFYPMSKAYPNNSAVVYNNKAYGDYIKITFTTLRLHLVRPKDAVEPAKQDGVVYRIPCNCGEVYIGETGRPTQDRIKEHERDIRLARTQISAVSEHANNIGHYPLERSKVY